MTAALCVLGHPARGQHLPQCTDTVCAGCRPALATSGLAVCLRHELATRAGLRDMPGLWADLGDTRRSPLGADRGGGGPGPELLAAERIEARHGVRVLLVSWCLLLDEDLGVLLPECPPDTVRWMGHWVARHAGRILASGHAGALVSEVSDAMSARRLLEPARAASGVRVRCPACRSWVRLRDDGDVIQCRGTVDGEPCQEWGTIEHWRRLVPDADEPMTARELVAWLAAHHRYRTTEDVVWQWASRGTRVGRLTRVDGEDGTARYDPVRAAEIVMMLRARST